MNLPHGAVRRHGIKPFNRPMPWPRVRLPAAIVALALLAAAVHAAAQGSPSAAPGVTVTFADDAGTVTVDRPSTFRATVRNTSSGTGTPGDGNNQADVDVHVSGLPEGWTASATPSSFRLAPGAEQVVEVQVSVAAEATAGSADVTLTADLVSPLGGLDPVLGNIPGGSQRASGSDAIRLSRDDSVTRDVLEALGPWIYAVLLLLVAAVLVAVAISLSSRRSLVRLSSETRELQVPPGGRVVFPFQLQSLARQEDSVLLQVSAVQEGWAAFLPVPEVVLDPGQVQEMTLVVIAPRNASDGSRQAVLVSATSAKAPKGAANLEFVATVHGGTPLRAAKRAKEE